MALGVGCGWMGVGWLEAHTCMCGKHDNFMQMAAPIGGIPENSLLCHTPMHVHVCVCVHMCRGTLSPPPPPSTHPHPQGDPQNQSKFNSARTNQDISILFEDLKSVEIPPPMGGGVGGSMGGSGQMTNN